MKIVKYYCDLCGEEIRVNDITEVPVRCTLKSEKYFNKELITCFNCWNNTIKNVCEQKNKKTSMLSIIKNSINSHLQRGDKIKAVHVTSEDFEAIKEESYVVIENPDTCFGYPLVTDAEFTHIEVEEMTEEDKFTQCVKMWLHIGELKARLQRENEVLRALLNQEDIDSELKRLIKENEELKIKVNGS